MHASFCSDCGAVLPAGSAFCTGCGRPVATGATPYGRRPAPRRRSRTGWIVAMVVAVLLVPVAVVGVVGVVGYRVWQEQRAFAEQMRREELIDFMEVDETAPPADGAYEVSALDRKPELLNGKEVAAAMGRSYPALLRDAGVAGLVQVKLKILPGGTVDASSVEVLEASHDAFVEPTTRVAARMRFRPGEVADAPVSTWVVVPVTWQTAQ